VVTQTIYASVPKQCKELIYISTGMGLKGAHTNLPLINVWAGLVEELPHISSIAVKKLCKTVSQICNNKDEIPQEA
jgi:hypothetical protein